MHLIPFINLPLLARPSQSQSNLDMKYRLTVLSPISINAISTDILVIRNDDRLTLPTFVCRPTVVIFTENTTDATHRAFCDFLYQPSMEKVVFMGSISKSLFEEITSNKEKISCSVHLKRDNLNELAGRHNLFNVTNEVLCSEEALNIEYLLDIIDPERFDNLFRKSRPFWSFSERDAKELARFLDRYL